MHFHGMLVSTEITHRSLPEWMLFQYHSIMISLLRFHHIVYASYNQLFYHNCYFYCTKTIFCVKKLIYLAIITINTLFCSLLSISCTKHFPGSYLELHRKNSNVLLPPFSRKRCSVLITPADRRSASALRTVDSDKCNSLAMVGMAGQQVPALLQRLQR